MSSRRGGSRTEQDARALGKTLIRRSASSMRSHHPVNSVRNLILVPFSHIISALLNLPSIMRALAPSSVFSVRKRRLMILLLVPRLLLPCHAIPVMTSHKRSQHSPVSTEDQRPRDVPPDTAAEQASSPHPPSSSLESNVELDDSGDVVIAPQELLDGGSTVLERRAAPVPGTIDPDAVASSTNDFVWAVVSTERQSNLGMLFTFMVVIVALAGLLLICLSGSVVTASYRGGGGLFGSGGGGGRFGGFGEAARGVRDREEGTMSSSEEMQTTRK